MTRRVLGAQIPLIQRGEGITANWLNSVAAAAERRYQPAQTEQTQEPEGQDGEGTLLDSVWTEQSRVVSQVRISDDTDPTVFVDIDRIDEITFTEDGAGTLLTLKFDNS